MLRIVLDVNTEKIGQIEIVNVMSNDAAGAFCNYVYSAQMNTGIEVVGTIDNFERDRGALGLLKKVLADIASQED